jgi:hypothetical protein
MMLAAGERLARPPIVEDLVVVPLRDRGDLGIEREQVLVEQIVFPVAGSQRGIPTLRSPDKLLALGSDYAPSRA